MPTGIVPVRVDLPRWNLLFLAFPRHWRECDVWRPSDELEVVVAVVVFKVELKSSRFKDSSSFY